MNGRDNKGFSLVEMVVTIAILAVASGVLFGFIITATNMYSRSKSDINVQAEAQTAINWINDKILSCEVGLKVEPLTAGKYTLIIHNNPGSDSYKVIYYKDDEVIKCVKCNYDGTDIPGEVEDILAYCVKEFSVDLTAVETTDSSAGINLQVVKNDKSVDLNRTVSIRNAIKVNPDTTALGGIPMSALTVIDSIVVTPKAVNLIPGATQDFSARVSGKGYPSQNVMWELQPVSGGTLSAGTQIDSNGTLTIDPSETVPQIKVVAKSSYYDATGASVQVESGADSADVLLASTTDIVADYIPYEKVPVGRIIQLKAHVNGINLTDDMKKVEWSIVGDYDGAVIDKNSGYLRLGKELLNHFNTVESRQNAQIAVRATSVANPSLVLDGFVSLEFGNQSGVGDLKCTARRNDFIDLSIVLDNNVVISKADMNVKWSIVNAGGVGSKVSIDPALGILDIKKDIDFSKDYTVDVKAEIYSIGTKELFDTVNIKVLIPHVEIVKLDDSVYLDKGSSARLYYEVAGLKIEQGDLQVSSTPAVRNTLLYVDGSYLVISAGMNVTKNNFVANLYMTNYSTIKKSVDVTLRDIVISTDNNSSMGGTSSSGSTSSSGGSTNVVLYNVDNYNINVPVPGTIGAPTVSDIASEGLMSKQVDDVTVYYWVQNSSVYMQLGSVGQIYKYNETSETNIKWVKAASTVKNPTEIVSGNKYKLLTKGKYKFDNSTISKCLDKEYGTDKTKFNVQTWQYKGETQQKWKIVKNNSGYYYITCSVTNSSGGTLVLSVASSSDTNVLVATKSDGDYKQQWSLVRTSDGYYTIKNRSTGKYLALDVGSTEQKNVYSCNMVYTDTRCYWQAIRVE